MPRLTVGEMLTRVTNVLQDADYDRWTKAELIDWLNESYIQVVSLRPDATATRTDVSLRAGAYQDMDDGESVALADAFALIKVVRNKGLSKRAIRGITLDELDAFLPDWYEETPTNNIERWSFDKDAPREFIVYPPALAGTKIEVLYADHPGEHNPTGDSDGEEIKLKDYYAPMLVDYVLYRAFSKDADDVTNSNRASSHLQLFTAGLGVKSGEDGQAQ